MSTTAENGTRVYILSTDEVEESHEHALNLMERSWPVPRDGTTWLHCAVCQKHVWTVPTRLLA